jgi:hypothetical protein
MLHVLEYAAIMCVYFFFTSHAYDVVCVLVTFVSLSLGYLLLLVAELPFVFMCWGLPENSTWCRPL